LCDNAARLPSSLLPGRTACPTVPLIHSSVLGITNGIIDQRGLWWLSSQNTSTAKVLRENLTARLPRRWADAAVNPADLHGSRDAIIETVRKSPVAVKGSPRLCHTVPRCFMTEQP
jgi:hypothetical protein